VSSLLDILHRRDGRSDPVDVPEAEAAPAAPTMELRLAVDNGPADPAASPVADPDFTQPYADSTPGPALHAHSDAVDSLAAASAGPTPAFDATRVLPADYLQRRARRSTLLLGAGLVVIVLGAALATWLLNETTGLATQDDSLFMAPAPGASFPRDAATGVVERPAPAPVQPSAVATPVAPERTPDPGWTEATEPVTEDTAWYDMPALEVADGDDASQAIRITRGTTSNPLFPKLSEAWTAFQAADFVRAEALYAEVRTADPGNVDALLGLGALAARGDRTEEARTYYQAVLLAEPRNATAISAMSTLPATGTRDLDESALKDLLRDQPGAANLHFALGLSYMTQGRWADAQTAFFDAVRLEPANADYAYNLAVSLDHLGQSRPAAAYYQRALELAGGSSLFDAGAAAERLAALRPATR